MSDYDKVEGFASKHPRTVWFVVGVVLGSVVSWLTAAALLL